MSHEHDPADLDARTWGRRAFLGALGAGALAVVAGRPVWNAVSQPLTAVSNALPEPVREALPLDGWRIYAVNPPMPDFDPATFRLRVTGLVDRDLDLSWSDVQGLPRVAQASDFHCVTGWSVDAVRWEGFRLQALFDRAGLQSKATHLEFVSLEKPYVDTLSVRAGAAARRARRRPHGRARDAEGARGAAAARDPADVRLQGRQVADGGPRDRPAAGRLLGAARLRHRRLGGPLQWPWLSGRRSATVRRFGRTERALHWASALAFGVLTATGLVLWLPVLATLVNDRPLVKAIHLWSAVLLGIAIVLVVLAGNRRALRRTARDVDRFDRYDRAWLRGAPHRALRGGEAPPAGRFNAGQKLNVVIVCAAWLLFGVSGTFLYLGERDHTFQLERDAVPARRVDARDAAAGVRPHLHGGAEPEHGRRRCDGMTRGTVDADWAERHHPRWDPDADTDAERRR